MIARPDQLGTVQAGPGTERPAGPGGSGTNSHNAITSWLDILCSLLRFPPAEAQSVRDELEGHLRERVRDLIVTGMTESQAAGAAVDELGDAAALAREFRAARRTPHRRMLMNLAVVGLAAGAAVTSLVAISGGLRPQSVAVSVFQPAARTAQAPQVTIRFQGAQDVVWRDFFGTMGKMANMPVFVHWNTLKSVGGEQPIEEESEVHIRLSGDFTLDSAMDFLSDDLGLSPDDRIDVRVRDGRLIFASTAFFDRQETTLATYDLTDLVSQRILRGEDEGAAPAKVIEEVSHLITTLVHSEQWADNGGDRASLTHYGNKLFVKAPKRFQPQIQWILAEVGSNEAIEPSKHSQRSQADRLTELRVTADTLRAQAADIAAKRKDVEVQLAALDGKGPTVTDLEVSLRALRSRESAIQDDMARVDDAMRQAGRSGAK